ncbi:MAG: hypothetical protein ACP5F3_00490 [Candidatus Syntrophosphaera sp.]
MAITASGIFIMLDWPDVPGANSYLVYGADDPYSSSYTLLASRPVSDATFAAATHKYFKVVASSDSPN